MKNDSGTRHYIGLVDGVHVIFTVGTGKLIKFFIGPWEPMANKDGVTYYQVSQEIAEEWVKS